MRRYVYKAARKDSTVYGIRLNTEYDNYPAQKAYANVGMHGRMLKEFEIDFVFGPDANN